jgi:hypothetical protein
MDKLIRDLAFSLRVLLRRPEFAIVAILSLGIGIAPSTTIFTLINDVFAASPAISAFRPLAEFMDRLSGEGPTRCFFAASAQSDLQAIATPVACECQLNSGTPKWARSHSRKAWTEK